MNEHPSPELEKELQETFSAPNADPNFVRDLRVTLIERSKMKQQTRFSPRLTWGIAIAILLIGLLVASPNVVQALKNLFGYIPGVGYVEQGNALRVLSVPVTLQKDGLIVTIEKGAADTQHTILFQHIEGYIMLDRFSERYCDTPARLVLPDGTVLKESSYETTMESGKDAPSGKYFGRYVFETLPAGQMDATLEIPCVMYDSRFTDFKFQLHFQIADSTQVMPVIDLPTEPAPQADPTPAPVSTAASTVEGFSIVLESEIPLDDGYILAGSYQWTDPRFDGFSAYPSVIQITDVNGKEANVESVDPIATNTDPAIKKLPFAWHIMGKDYAFPLTISVQSIIATLSDTATFQFDFGPDPQVGQTWNVDIDVPIAGHVINVQTIQLTSGRTPTELGFTFTMISDSTVTGAYVVDTNPIINSTGGSGSGGGGGADGGYTVGPFTSGWAIDGYSPAGGKTFAISDLSLMFEGSWQATWQGPAK